ncbi:MAG TPA: bifunctional diaminohydroxyphosphoribosylaminopyrimidine deaminase/5-amino-6-(5-phosphoribosylamino)uracil reductase RibD [Planctomycetota bacterium]|nr:bifunctional diaminohydroxyphosphoribosylaminopyrimidine deaminase/5-amino-6-(5-phosphoribosylamino)uracil reductase RibD [Planctomycetota bacterium]
MPSAIDSLDETFLRALLAELAGEARAWRFEVAPNPCVGAAVLAGERIVARGHHRAWGGAHAEVEALAAARSSGVPPAEWDTLVVTLEPCSSSGKTPACSEAILAAARDSGLRRVIVGCLDPDPRHRGVGLTFLRDAGMEVLLVEHAAPLERVAPQFLAWNRLERQRRPRPWVVAKWAQTRSGHLIPPPDIGEGRWISGEDALREVHVLRGRVDAIVTGVSTVLADDPRLSVRPPGSTARAPLRVVLDSYLRTPVDGRLLAPPQPGEVVGQVHVLCQAGAHAARHRALEQAGAHITGLHASEDDHVRLRDVLEWLWNAGVRRALLEAGPELVARMIDEGFVDQVRIYTGNVGGGRGDSLAELLSRVRLEQRLERECGDDSVLEGFLYDEREGR